MQIILTPDQMRQLEQDYFAASGTPSAALMHRAAEELVRAMDERNLVRGKRITFLCGGGGNGGDGLAAAAICQSLGAKCEIVLLPTGAMTADATHYLHALPGGIPLHAAVPSEEPDVWVDATFGIGLNRPIVGMIADAIARINASPAPTVSVDIPSGLDGRTGEILGCAVEADLTVTFQHPKPGHFLGHGLDLCGELTVRDIGLPPPPYSNSLRRPQDTDISALLPRRRHFSHKNTYGHLLVIAGSRGMAGAAAICASAALHSGAGLVTIACPQEILPILQTLVPEAMALPLPQNDAGALSADALPVLADALRGKSAVAIGPGLSRNAAPEILRAVLESGLPALIDADGLNLLSVDPALKALLNANHLITPHPGEAARLIPAMTDPLSNAAALHALGCTAIYKGATSVIAGEGQYFLSDSGSPCMAKGGSGDMLTGIAASLMAQGLTPAHAALAASHIHGRAGEAAEARFGKTYPTATDLIRALPEVWRRFEP